MGQEKASVFLSPVVRGWLIVIGIIAVVLSLPVYASVSLGYTETKGPFKNWTQVVDWEADGDLDVIVSHTRWEDVDLSWAMGVGRWVNQGNGTFELVRDRGQGRIPSLDLQREREMSIKTEIWTYSPRILEYPCR